MNVARILVVALAFSLVLAGVVPGTATAEVRGYPVVDVFAPENRLVPGEETDLELTLENDGVVTRSSTENLELEEIVKTARGVVVTVTSADAPVTVETAPRAIGTLPEGTSDPLPFRVVVDEDARPGTYDVEVKVEYTYVETVLEEGDVAGEFRQYEDAATQTFEVPVVVEERARFEVVDTESNVAVGTSGTVRLTVENVGAAVADDTRLTVRSDNSEVTFGTGDPTATDYVRSWEPGENRTFTFRTNVAADAVVRNYALSGVVEYEGPEGQSRTSEPLFFGLTPLGESTFAVEAVAADLRVGEEGEIIGEVINVGATPVRNATLVVEPYGETITFVETRVALGNLAPGEAAPFRFDADVSDLAEDGDRQFSFVVVHRDADGSELRSDPLDVRVTVDGERDIFDVQSGEVRLGPGEEGPLTLTIRNDYDETLTDISAKLFVDAPLSTTDDEAFISELAPGENTTVTFGVGVAPGAIEKDYPASVDFQYDDADGDTKVSESYRVPVGVASSDRSAGDGPLTSVPGSAVVLAGLAATLGAGVYLYRRFR
jgi:hypothetical protein